MAQPTGPAGPSQILTSDIYIVIGTPSAPGGTSTAQCNLTPAVDTVLGGGFNVNPEANPNNEPRRSEPLPSETGWIAEANPGTVITAYAVCFDN